MEHLRIAEEGGRSDLLYAVVATVTMVVSAPTLPYTLAAYEDASFFELGEMDLSMLTGIAVTGYSMLKRDARPALAVFAASTVAGGVRILARRVQDFRLPPA